MKTFLARDDTRILSLGEGAMLLLWGCGPDLGHEYTEPIDILDDAGEVVARGWARTPLFGFSRDAAPESLRGQIREWDYYNVYTDEFAVSVTLAKISLSGQPVVLGSITVHDYAAGVARGDGGFALDPDGELVFDPDPGGNYSFGFGDARLTYAMDGDLRVIERTGPDGAHIEISGAPAESLALVTPYDEPGVFFYEDKALPLQASGHVEIDGLRFEIPSGSAAVMDFARGVMPQQMHWEWATAFGEVDGERIGINLGSVYGDEEGGTPNAVIIGDTLYKLGRVDWTYDLASPADPWTLVGEGVDLRLEVDRGYVEQQHTAVGDYHIDLVKPSGRFYGTVEVDGLWIDVDGWLGAAEAMDTAW